MPYTIYDYAPINIFPHNPPGAMYGEQTKNVPLGWGICPQILSNLKSRVFSSGFDHPICPNGGVFISYLVKSPPTAPCRGIVGLTNNRCITLYVPL